MWAHALIFYAQCNQKRTDGLVTIFERFRQVDALRFAEKLGCLREYVRGDADVLHDLTASWELYEAWFPEPKARDY